jgi:hypothetical protein
MSADERQDLDLRVYVANSNPTSHPVYHSPVLSLTDGVVSASNITTSNEILEKLRQLEHQQLFIEKSALDFSLALEHCYKQSNSPYIALFEDDILAVDGWFVRTKLAIQQVEAIAAKRQRGWSDLRLFNDSKEIRWTAYRFGRSNVPISIVLLPLFICTISAVSFVLLGLIRRMRFGRSLSEQSSKIICVFSIPVFIVTFFKTGYLSTIPRPDGISVQPWGCCTQGEIFPRSRIPELIKTLRDRASKSPADLTIWDFASDNNLLRLALDPPIVQHIGFSSILEPNRKRKKTVWSVAYEDWDATKLANEHKGMVEILYKKDVKS